MSYIPEDLLVFACLCVSKCTIYEVKFEFIVKKNERTRTKKQTKKKKGSLLEVHRKFNLGT